MSKQPRPYGNILAGTGKLDINPVDRIVGGLLEYNEAGDPASLRLHYESQGRLHGLTFPIDEAVFLLAMLKAIQLDHNIPFPDDPRKG